MSIILGEITRGDAIVANNKKRNDAMTIGIAIGIVIGIVPSLYADNLVIGIAIGIVIGIGITVLKR
ncbi:septum formation initiator [Bacillus thuringiensis]|nr:septum formation initiator [Bacillus thuringiensis]